MHGRRWHRHTAQAQRWAPVALSVRVVSCHPETHILPLCSALARWASVGDHQQRFLCCNGLCIASLQTRFGSCVQNPNFACDIFGHGPPNSLAVTLLVMAELVISLTFLCGGMSCAHEANPDPDFCWAIAGYGLHPPPPRFTCGFGCHQTLTVLARSSAPRVVVTNYRA